MPVPQQILASLFSEASVEFVVRTLQPRGSGYPSNYKLDLAFPFLKLGIEVDGMSHNTLLMRGRDKKKVELLESLGWCVLRVSNDDVLQKTTAVFEFIISQLQARKHTLSDGVV